MCRGGVLGVIVAIVTRRASTASDVDKDSTRFLEEALPHLDALYRIARHCGQDHHRAEDVVQETMLRAYSAYGTSKVENVRAWLVTISLNVIRSDARRRRRRIRETPLEEQAHDAPAGVSVSEETMARLDRSTVAQALARLPEPQRVAIVLMDLASLSASEAAGILGCSRNTVLSRVHRGRMRLATLLAGQEVKP